MLATFVIPVAASHHCRDLERAVAVAAEIGAPVALKADFAAPTHASDIDAVMLGLEGESALRSSWCELERRVQAAGREWIGAILGRGAAFRLLQETDAVADELINSAEGVATQLDGFRGSALLDRDALRELIPRFALAPGGP